MSDPNHLPATLPLGERRDGEVGTATWNVGSAPEGSSGRLAQGTVLAGRFRVERFIGRGGMGEVYEAFDRELGTRVALKTLRAEIASEPQMLDRFRREIQLSRQVTHPNVCRIFDLFRHAQSDEEVVFLTMELLDGETLSQRLRRGGALAAAEAQALALQMAAGLEAAHATGVIHRDFKSANVMLVPAGEGLRAVVTDFGLARSAGEHGPLRSEQGVQLTGREELIGTLAYMAPEQLEKTAVTAASDVYAFGIVLYEMLTGSLPFEEGAHPLSAALRRLREKPAPLRGKAPHLDPRWEQIVRRCLELEPGRRFRDAGELLAALGGWSQPRRRERRWLRRAIAGGGLAAVLVLLGLVALRRPVEQASPVLGPSRPRPAVAVLGFNNLLQRREADWLAVALPEMLTTELAAGGELRLIPQGNVVRMLRELGVSDVGQLDDKTRARIHRYLGADLLVLGSYAALGAPGEGQIRLDVQVQPALPGGETAFVAQTGSENGLFELVSQTGARLREELGAGELDPEERRELVALRPADPEVARLHAEGLAALRRYDAQRARDLLEQAAMRDASFPLAWADLAAAWAQLGYEQKARQAAERAFELRAGLGREESLRVEGSYREMIQDWPRAIEIFASLWHFFPDNLEHGLRLAAAEVRGGRGQDALETLAELRRLPAPSRDDPRIDLAEAEAAGSLSDLDRQLAAARQAAVAAEQVGARQLLAQALMAQSGAERQRGELDAAAATLARAAEISEQIGYLRGVAEAHKGRGVVLWMQGEIDAAAVASQRAAEIFEQIGDRRDLARTWNNLGMVLDLQGDQDAAEAIYRRALEAARAVGDAQAISGLVFNLALIAHERGELEQARRGFEEALAIKRTIGERATELLALGALGVIASEAAEMETARARLAESLAIAREIGDRLSVARFLTSLGSVEADLGELGAARGRIEDALRIGRELGSQSLIAAALNDLAYLHLLQDELPAARRAGEEALALAEEQGDQREVAAISVRLATIARLDGEAQPALEHARRAVAASTGALGEVNALTALALAQLASGETAAAVVSLEQAQQRVHGAELRFSRLSLEIRGAPIRLEQGPPQTVRRQLEAALAECRERGLAELGFEAELALALLPLGEDNPHAAPEAVDGLARRADTAGFALFARQARGGLTRRPLG